MTREVEDRSRTAEQLGIRGETNGQKEQIVNELVKIHQQFLSRVNHVRSFLHTMINYCKNTSKIETQMINNSCILSSSSLPNDIRSTEVLVRQYEIEQEKILQTHEQCRQDAQSAENKANQVGCASLIDRCDAFIFSVVYGYFSMKSIRNRMKSRGNIFIGNNNMKKIDRN